MKDVNETAPGRTRAVEEEIIAMSVLNFERMPMLDLIFERFVLSLAKAFRSYTSAPTSAEIADIHYTTYDHAMLAVGDPCMIGIAEVAPWGGPMAVALDAGFLFAALEVIMGGRTAHSPGKQAAGFTRIETRIARKLCELALADLAEAFRQVAELSFAITRMEGTAQLATITQPQSPCVKADFHITFGGQGGVLSLILPHAAVEPVRELLTKVFYGEKLGGDREWRGHLSAGIRRSAMPARAVLGEVSVPLRDVLGWRPGQTVDLGLTDTAPATLWCAGAAIARGSCGQRETGAMALRVEDTFDALGDIAAALAHPETATPKEDR